MARVRSSTTRHPYPWCSYTSRAWSLGLESSCLQLGAPQLSVHRRGVQREPASNLFEWQRQQAFPVLSWQPLRREAAPEAIQDGSPVFRTTARIAESLADSDRNDQRDSRVPGLCERERQERRLAQHVSRVAR